MENDAFCKCNNIDVLLRHQPAPLTAVFSLCLCRESTNCILYMKLIQSCSTHTCPVCLSVCVTCPSVVLDSVFFSFRPLLCRSSSTWTAGTLLPSTWQRSWCSSIKVCKKMYYLHIITMKENKLSLKPLSCTCSHGNSWLETWLLFRKAKKSTLSGEIWLKPGLSFSWKLNATRLLLHASFPNSLVTKKCQENQSWDLLAVFGEQLYWCPDAAIGYKLVKVLVGSC